MTIEAQLLLDYEKVKSQLMTYAMSYLGRSRIVELKASVNQRQIEGLLWETEEALRVVVSGSSVPIPSLDGVESSLSHLEKGFVLSEQEIGSLVQFMLSTQQLKRYMEKKGEIAPRVAAYALSLDGLDELVTELLRSVEHGQVTDEASDALARIRKKIRVQADRLDRKLQSVLQKYSKFLQDHIVTTRNGRHVLSVKREHKRAIKGTIVDESASGQTVFMEPNDLLALQDEMNELKILEELERARVLGVLTGMIDARLSSIKQNLEITGHYDFLFAKAKYAKALGARSVKVNGSGRIDIRGGRHPLLEGQCIPLDFRIGQTYRALVITGPNTGGKTVTLKTVGLLTLMVQSGLLVPVEEGSEFAVFSEVLVDIGDGQSLEQSLSTFSAHVRNIIDILNRAGKNTLILLDELASGTDPGEGIGLSIAVLEELHRRGSTILATTHYSEIKSFAEVTPGFENARMAFDVDTLQPLYRLHIGEAGQSYAFEIAQKLGIPTDIIHRSREISARRPQPSGLGSFPAQAEPAREARQVAKLRQHGRRKEKPADAQKAFNVGDRVWIHALKCSGIVYSLPDYRGSMVVLVRKRQMTFNVKRVAPYLSREELYPDADNYDLDIVLESKEVRKKRKIMRRKHMPGLTIEYREGDGR